MRALVFLIAVGLSAAELPKTVNDGYGEMLVVPAGSFTMGDTFGDGESREGPAHVVTLDAYYVAKFEVTNGDWKKFLNDPGYNDAKLWPGGGCGAEGSESLLDAGGESWRGDGGER